MPAATRVMRLKRPQVVPEQKALFFLGNAAVFVIVAVFLNLLGRYVSNDVGEYVLLWDRVRDLDFLDAWLGLRYEIGSLLVFWLVAQVLSPLATFYFVGLAAFSVKFYLIRRYLHYPLIALCLYVALFLHLHDANQIRAAIAACFVLYAVVAPTGGRLSFLVLAGIASLFHYSGWIILVLYGVRAPITGLAAIVVVSFAWDYVIASSAALSFAVLFLSREAKGVNLTNSLFVMQAVIAIAIALQWKRLSEAQKKGAYLVVCGVVFYVSFIDNPIMAHRLRELSMIGVFPLLFLGDRKWRYTFVMIWMGVAYMAAYDLALVLIEMFSAMA